MAWALAGDRTPTTYSFSGAATSTVITLTAAIALGSLITLRWATGGSTALPTSASDSAGNTYQLDKAQANGTSDTGALFTAYAGSALAIGATITVNHPSCSNRILSVHEWTGGPSTGWLDVVAASVGLWSSTALPDGAVTTTQSSDLVTGSIYQNSTGWSSLTQPATWTGMTERFSGGLADLWGGYRLNQAAATYTYNPTPGTTTGINSVDIVAGYSLVSLVPWPPVGSPAGPPLDVVRGAVALG